jgi:hypothetical protein
MRTAILLLTVFAAMAIGADDSPLVKAAKASGGQKKKTTKRKVITNADVKSAKGNLVVLPPKPGQTAAAAVVDTRGPLEKQSDDRRARSEADLHITAAQKKVDDLQKELRRIEDAYYAENDPNYRDSAIEQRFTQTKKQLDDARKELADARDARTRLAPKI